MRRVLFACFSLIALSFASPPAHAGGNYPFCIKGSEYWGAGPAGDCSFPTYGACKAAASGRLAYCDRNPFYSGPGGPVRGKRRYGNPDFY